MNIQEIACFSKVVDIATQATTTSVPLSQQLVYWHSFICLAVYVGHTPSLSGVLFLRMVFPASSTPSEGALTGIVGGE